jgi:hypothetical protein
MIINNYELYGKRGYQWTWHQLKLEL